jgi:hypothetical protein
MPAPTDPPSAGDTPDVSLDELDLPARLIHFAERRGLRTLRQLAAIAPDLLRAERNIGRGSMAAARAAIQGHFGCVWEDLAGGRADAADGAPLMPPSEGRPADDVPDVPLDRLDLPTRIVNWAARNRVISLRQLARFSPAELIGERHLGQGSIRQARAVIESRLGCSWERFSNPPASAPGGGVAVAAVIEPTWERGLLATWEAAVAKLPYPTRVVMALRSGLLGFKANTRLTGELMAMPVGTVVSQERRTIAALQRRGKWIADARGRIDATLPDKSALASALAAHPFWKGIAAQPRPFEYVGRRLLGGRFRVAELPEGFYVAPCSPDDIEASWAELHRAAAGVPVPAPEAAFAELSSGLDETLGGALAGVLRRRLEERLDIARTADGLRVVDVLHAPGKGAFQIEALRASPVPLRLRDFAPRKGRLVRTPEMLVLGRGVVGLPQHFPDLASWKRRLVPAALRVMRAGTPGRQWDGAELREAIAGQLELPSWLTSFHVVAALQGSARVRHLGQQRVMPADARAAPELLSIAARARAALVEHGGPMPYRDLLASVRERAAAVDTTFALILQGPQFIRPSHGIVGLRDRDLPGGEEAARRAADHLVAALGERGRGLSARQAHLAVTKLSALHARWTEAMTLSCLRCDPRLRRSGAGAVGLSMWGSVRMPSHREVLQEGLAQGGGRMRIAILQKRITALRGKPLSKMAVWALAHKTGVSVQGEWIVPKEP